MNWRPKSRPRNYDVIDAGFLMILLFYSKLKIAIQQLQMVI